MDFLYVARGEGGLIKIGVSKKPRNRGQHLAREFRLRGDRIAQMRVCPGTGFAYTLEAELRADLARAAATTSGKEWFTGLLFDDVYRLAYGRVMRLRQAQLFGNWGASSL